MRRWITGGVLCAFTALRISGQATPTPPTYAPAAIGSTLVFDTPPPVANPFHQPGFYESPLRSARQIGVGDFNGDGLNDLVAAPSYFNFRPKLPIQIWANLGNGAFADRTADLIDGSAPTTGSINNCFVADFNGDGRADIFIVDQGLEDTNANNPGFSGDINIVLLSQPNGKLKDTTAESLPGQVKAFNHVSSLGDIDGDGLLDMIVTRMGGPAVPGDGTLFFLNDGAGRFRESTAGLPPEIAWRLTGLPFVADRQATGANGVIDLDNDGQLDLVTGSYSLADFGGVRTLRFYRQADKGAFVERMRLPVPPTLADIGYFGGTFTDTHLGVGVAGVFGADLNRDGRNDVVVLWESGGPAGSFVEILRNDGNFQFTDVTLDWLGSYGAGNFVAGGFGPCCPDGFLFFPSSLQLRDVNGDDSPDLIPVTRAGYTSDLLLDHGFAWLNDGTGHLAPLKYTTAGSPASTAGLDTALDCPPPHSCHYRALIFDATGDRQNDLVLVSDPLFPTTDTPYVRQQVLVRTLKATTPSARPAVSIDRAALRFGATNTGSALIHRTSGQQIRILQNGAGQVVWKATPNRPWIKVSPVSGTGPAVLTVTVDFDAGLPLSGLSAGAIVLSFSGAANTAGPVSVRLTTMELGSAASPTGVFETPQDGTTGVTGSIAVTGWALDDIGIARVRVLREPVGGEGPGLVFIGDAVRIDGARPDVAAAFPAAPQNTRAGWGYLMLTNFLPNRGDGTFTLHAFADDVDGHSVDLGTKTITCANSTAVRPFGAIDTPTQGETISGAAFPNFGWVLARTPALASPPNGTVRVVIDGAFQPASPVGWTARPDLTLLFPATSFPGVSTALGLYPLDTTVLADGVHSIAWIVTADNGQSDGIGSRFFTVANGTAVNVSASRTPSRAVSLAHLEAAPMSDRHSGGDRLLVPDAVNGAPLIRRPVVGRRGYDPDAPLRTFAADPGGRVTLHGEELDRFELRLADESDIARGERFSGYLRVGNALESLPIGSKLDAATGVFTWQPGPGFLHGYDFVFVRSTSGRAAARREVRVVINPRGTNRTGPQVVIDLPPANARVQQPFVIAGWAIDGDGFDGTGVDALHVWAYPVTTCNGAPCHAAPVFLGAAATGGRRPDVAAMFGDRFRESGYGLTADSLVPGTYDVAVFAWSRAAGGFMPARLVRVIVR